MRKVTPETILKSQCKDMLNMLGIFHYHNMAGLGCYPGLPDRTAHINGQVVYLEFKAGTRMSDNQKRFAEQCQEDGIPYYEVKSVDELIKIIKKHKEM